MWRLCAVFPLLLALTGPARAGNNYQDWWWNPAQSGMGWNIGQQGGVIFVAWFNYDAAGNPSFLSLAGSLSGNKLSGELTRSTGPLPGPGFDPDAVTRTTVGSATLEFTSSDSAVFSYDYEGHSGSVDLSRFTFSSDELAGSWAYLLVATLSGCNNPAQNISFRSKGVMTSSLTNGSLGLTLTDDDDGSVCTTSAALSNQGSLHQGSGSLSCNGGETGSIVLRDLRGFEDNLTAGITLNLSGSAAGCIEEGRLTAVRQ